MIYMSGKMNLSGNVYIGPQGDGGGENPGGGDVEPIPYERFGDPLYLSAFAPIDSVMGTVLVGEVTGLTYGTPINTYLSTEDSLYVGPYSVGDMSNPDAYQYWNVGEPVRLITKHLGLNPDIYGTGLFELSYRDNQIWSSYINNGRIHLVHVGANSIVQPEEWDGEDNSVFGWAPLMGSPTPQNVPIWRYLVGGLITNETTNEAMVSTDLLTDYYDLRLGRKLKYNNVVILDIESTTTIGDFLGAVNDLAPGRIVAWIEENIGDAGMSSRIVIIDKGNNPISIGWRDPSHEFLEEPTAFEVRDLGFSHQARFQGSAPGGTTFDTDI